MSGVPRFTSSRCSMHKVFHHYNGLYFFEIHVKGLLGRLEYNFFILRVPYDSVNQSHPYLFLWENLHKLTFSLHLLTTDLCCTIGIAVGIVPFFIDVKKRRKIWLKQGCNWTDGTSRFCHRYGTSTFWRESTYSRSCVFCIG